MLNATPDALAAGCSPLSPAPGRRPEGAVAPQSGGSTEARSGPGSAIKDSRGSETAARERKAQRYRALLWLYSNSELRSQRFCLKTAVPGQTATLSKRDRRTSLTQVRVCGRPDCPWCGPRWSEQKAALLGLAITEHVADGGMVVMATYTVRHRRHHELADLWALMGKAFTYATHGHKSSRALLDELAIGFAIRKETTHGDNGWHPHLHVAYFLRPGVSMIQVRALADAHHDDLNAVFDRHGEGNVINRDNGVTLSEPITAAAIDTVEERVSKYLAKDSARELTANSSKLGRRAGNRTTAQLLHDAAAGDRHAAALYRTYEKVMFRKPRLRFSPGVLALIPPELIAESEESEQGRSIALLPDELLQMLRMTAWHGGLSLPDLLAASDDQEDDVEAFHAVAWLCSEHGLPDPVRPSRLFAGSEPARAP